MISRATLGAIATPPRTVLLTGATGFLGKVALFEMIRRRDELNLEGVIVVIRARGSRSAADRFQKEVASSPCFASLPAGWWDIVRVLDGDLATPGFGTAPDEQAMLATVTHVVHSAAAVSFTLPGAVAARANITTSLNLLAATRACPLLQRIVYVSTAYVTPHHNGKIAEALVPLPAPARELLATLESGTQKDKDVLALTGHPNTYTMTKAVAEHMMAEGRGAVPLTIVRPSIISASHYQPIPGWIDSTTGFGAFVMLIGLGHLRAVVGDPNVRLDLVPVDEVARCVIDEMIGTADGVTIRHSVAGKNRAPTVHECWDEIQRHFLQNPMQRRPARRYLGPRGSAFALADILHHRVPMALAAVGSAVRKRQAQKLASRMAYLNEVFPYFTTHTFDFALSAPDAHDVFNGRDYVASVCRGVSRHLLQQRDDEWVLAGRSHVGHGGDMKWVMRQPSGNAFVRTGIWLSTKTLRRIADSVTVDVPSFERARDSVPAGAAVALMPSHRSFLDFVLCSYLAFARPDLGIRVPYVAAAVEFGKIPLLGYLLRSVHAFYVERGASRENRHLAKRVHSMVDAGEVVEFFVEGARSRTRAFLRPKRGLLRCLESSGRSCVLLPIAISYDRVPEEQVFARELTGAPKSGLRLGPLFGWLADVWRGRVNIGRIHIACGAPVMLDAETNAAKAGDSIIRELRGAMAVTSFHIEAYAASNTTDGVTASALRAAIEAAGARVLESQLAVPPDFDPVIANTMREHFVHFLSPSSNADLHGEPSASNDWSVRDLPGLEQPSGAVAR
ncbi:MAG: SDR family oxidoreductase [Gemmatimonadota bacterium]|nr:SDR family oxidoreductase [Gemmatimonadota bacterium]